MPLVDVVTRSYDMCRSGANLRETTLNQASVKTRGVAHTGTLWLPGDLRGTEGSPLVKTAVKMADGLTRDVIVLASMANIVACYDFNTLEFLWARRVGNPIPNTRKYDMFLINDHWGITGTGYIDPHTSIYYGVSMSSPTGQFTDAKHHLHSLNLADGSDAAPPVDLSQATYQPPGGLKLQRMGAVPRKQRCALAADRRNGYAVVYVACGSFIESAATNQGWLIAVDVGTPTSPAVACAITSSARGSGGGFWMGSQGPSVHPETGIIGLVTGNGTFDGVTDFGESVIHYRYVPAANGQPAHFVVDSHFTPFTDMGRVYGARFQTLFDESQLPASVKQDGEEDGASNMDGADDADLGSGGKLDVTRAMSGYDEDYCIISGKDGVGYVVPFTQLGSPKPADFAPDKIMQRVYGLCRWVGWLTYYNPDASPCPTDLSTLSTTYAHRTHHLHGTPKFFRSSIHGPMIYVMGENGNLRAWALNRDGSLTYLACSAEYASPQAPVGGNNYGGMPGGLLSLSADGNKPDTALLYACIPWRDANRSLSPGRFVIYDPENFGTYADGSKQIMPLWDSANTGIAYTHCKFNEATITGGKILLPTYDGTVLVLELVK